MLSVCVNILKVNVCGCLCMPDYIHSGSGDENENGKVPSCLVCTSIFKHNGFKVKYIVEMIR